MTPNLSYIKQLADGSKEFEQKMILILKSEFPKEKDTYQKAIRDNDLFQAAELAHKIKHKLGMLSMEKAYQKAIEYEEKLKIGDDSDHQDFLSILEVVANYISSL